MWKYNSQHIFSLQENYGIDWSGPISESDEDNITIPELNSPVSDDEIARLEQLYTIDRILSSDFHAVDLYCEIVEQIIAVN